MDDVVVENRAWSAQEAREAYDLDDDGMPNLWEIANGLNPVDSGDAADNPDDDGYTNWQEWRTQTDPNNATSKPGEVVRLEMGEAEWTGLGNEVTDASPYGNHGRAVGGATTASDLWGTHGAFNGTNYVEIASRDSLQNAGDLTVSFWMKMTNAPAGGTFLAKSGAYGEFCLHMDTGRTITYYHGNSGYQSFQPIAGGYLPLGTWHHVVLTRDAATRRVSVYLNGGKYTNGWTYAESLLNNPGTTIAPLRIGLGLRGLMDEVVVENRAWSAQEARDAYDLDGDGMPNLWEIANGLDPKDESDSNIDADNDGFSNLQEYLGESDTRNFLSTP